MANGCNYTAVEAFCRDDLFGWFSGTLSRGKVTLMVYLWVNLDDDLNC